MFEGILFSSAIMFIGGLIIAAAVYLYAKFGSFEAIKQYLTETEEGRGAFGGIIKFVAFGIIFVAVSLFATCSNNAEASEPEGTWFSYGEVYLGLEWPKNDPSPQCVVEGPDSRGTSNGGIRLNVYRSADERFHAGLKYTHHSCSLNTDRNHYDAIGFELTYRFFSR